MPIVSSPDPGGLSWTEFDNYSNELALLQEQGDVTCLVYDTCTQTKIGQPTSGNRNPDQGGDRTHNSLTYPLRKGLSVRGLLCEQPADPVPYLPEGTGSAAFLVRAGAETSRVTGIAADQAGFPGLSSGELPTWVPHPREVWPIIGEF